MAKADGYVKASLLKAYSNEMHLLAAVRGIADRNAQWILTKNGASPVRQGVSDSYNFSQQTLQKKPANAKTPVINDNATLSVHSGH